MSTKIFNGYRLSGLAESAEVVSFLDRFRQALEPVYEGLYLLLAAHLATTLADRALLGEPGAAEGAPLSPWRHATAYMNARHRAIRETGIRDEVFDLDCQVVVLADPTPSPHLYALLFTSQREYTVAWEAMPGVEPWPYWDNSDRPDSVGEDDWEDRRRVWARTRPEGVAPARLGFTKSLLGPNHHYADPRTRERLAMFMPSRASRARTVARRRLRPTAETYSPWHLTPEQRAALDGLATGIEENLPELEPAMLFEAPR